MNNFFLFFQMDRNDTDRDGSINFKEFVKMMADKGII